MRNRVHRATKYNKIPKRQQVPRVNVIPPFQQKVKKHATAAMTNAGKLIVPKSGICNRSPKTCCVETVSKSVCRENAH